MKTRHEKYSVEELVNAWQDAQLRVNDEYQRGAKWSIPQQQALVDSIFRNYPIPPVFLHEIKSTALGGKEATRFDIVDGQQRIRALSDYVGNKFPLLLPDDRKLKLPNSLRSIPSPWSEKRFLDLQSNLRSQLVDTKVDVFVVEKVSESDEIRDLFIRLQAGTALSRQQIRDAWPGNIGPYIERLAGKLRTVPAIRLFQLADRRGNRNEDDRDKYEPDRQFCAQLLTAFMSRERDPIAVQSVAANDLDGLYHEYTTFDGSGESAKRFEFILKESTDVLSKAAELKSNKGGVRSRKKFRKLDIFALFCFIQDVTKNRNFRLNGGAKSKLAEWLLHDRVGERTGRTTSGIAIKEHYEKWRNSLPERIGLHLDPNRFFSEEQKALLFAKANGCCEVCGKPIGDGEAEYDHHPVPHHAGGATSVENGRLVHQLCHPRGRLSE